MGARGQLKVARHEKLLEVFADIAYGSGTGHRSVTRLDGEPGQSSDSMAKLDSTICHPQYGGGRAGVLL